MRGRKEEGDLKRGHVRDLNACVRSHTCRGVCVMWASALEQTQVSSNASPCLRPNVWRTIDRIVQSNFFFLQKYLQKIFTYTNQNIYTHKSTPPNLKCHIAHNVTEFTKPRGWVNSGVV
jgi:hypothetical protein